MQIKNYTILNTKLAKDQFLWHEGYLEKKNKVNIFEFYIDKLKIDNPNDVIYKILIPADIGNPIEIISCFIGFNGNLFIVLPLEFEKLSQIRGIYLDYDIENLNLFLKKEASPKLLLINGKNLSGKSYFANILNIFFVIKSFETLFFTAIFKLVQDVEIVNSMRESFVQSEEEEEEQIKKIQFGYFPEKYQKSFASKILSIASKKPVTIFFDNIDLLSKNVQTLILGIYKTIQLNPGRFPIVFCLISTNGISHLLMSEEFSRNSFIRKMLDVSFLELKKLINFLPIIKNNSNNPNQNDLLHHLYKITEGHLPKIQFVLSRIAFGQIAWDESFLSQSLNKIYSEEISRLNELDLTILSIFKTFKIPLSFLTFKYIAPICIDKKYDYDDIYDSIIKLKNLFLVSTTLSNKTIHMFLSYKEMLTYIPDYPEPNKIYEACGDYYKSIEENIELILYCYINSKNINKTIESLNSFIDYYKKVFDFEPILFYIDKVLQTFTLSSQLRFDLLYEKAEIFSHLSLWFESLTMLYELLPYSKRIEDIYYYICYNYFYLGEYDALEEFIQAYQQTIYSNPMLKIKIGFIQAPIFCIKNEKEKAINLINELYELISNEKDNTVLFKDFYICAANCYYLINDVAKAKEMINKVELKKDDFQSIPYFMEIYLLQAKFALYEKQYNLSLSWTNKGINLCENYYNLRYLSDFYTITALNLYYLKNYNSTLSYLKKASKLKEELNHRFDLGIIRYYEALTLFKLGNFSQAIAKTYKAAHIFKILDAKQYYKDTQILLIKAEFELRNYERAFYLLRSLSKDYEFTKEEKEELLFYMTKIQEIILSMNNTISIILDTKDFSKIPSYFNTMRNSRVSFDDISLKLVYSLQHIVDQNPHFEKVYEEILVYLTNYTNADVSYLVLSYPNNEFKIVSKYSPVNLTSSTNKEIIFELLKLKILYEEKVTTLSYDNENIVCIPLYRVSRLPSTRAKKLTSRIRKNYLGFIILFFTTEPKKEIIFSISNSYNVINSIIINSLEYSNLSKEDDHTYRFRVFKEIVIREAFNCCQEGHNFGFCYLKINLPKELYQNEKIKILLNEFIINLHHLLRSEDLMTHISDYEYFIFLPFAEKHGEGSLKGKVSSSFVNFYNKTSKKEIFEKVELYLSFSFLSPCEKNIMIDVDSIINELKEKVVKIPLNLEP
ncbi:MAG: hypothetical protein GYA61_01290 [Spirochaetales bacterium]|nr:hypothetical protein [Spirochaetales bacterium]